MAPLLAGKDASAGAAHAGEYVWHRPEQTLLYQLVEQYYPAFFQPRFRSRPRLCCLHLNVRVEFGSEPSCIPTAQRRPAPSLERSSEKDCT